MSALRKLVCNIVNKQVKVNNSSDCKCIIRSISQITSGIINSGLPDVHIPRVPVNEFIFENIGKWENHIAAKCTVTGRKYTYKQFRMKANNLGATLRKKLKLNYGDVVAVIVPNVPEFPIISVGIVSGGLVCTTVNPIYTSEEVGRQLLDSSAKAIITVTDLFPLAQASKSFIKKDIPVITIKTAQTQSIPDGAINFSEFTDNPCEFDVSINVDDLAYLPYSSGTTGLPKGVQLTHHNIVAYLCQVVHPEVTLQQETTNDHQDVTPVVIPMFHIYGLATLNFYQMRMGCQIITLPKFTPELYMNVLRNDKPHVLYVVPPIAIFLANHPDVKPQDLESVRTILTAAAPLGESDTNKLLQKAKKNIPIRQGYGLTEAASVLFNRLSLTNTKGSKGSLGKPFPNTEVKIINPEDPKGTPLGPNEQGELLARGPQVMKGYFNRSEENVFLDGWFRTGDMMYYNEEGFFFITDRLKELIKVKGFQVAPAELEEIIRSFPQVVEAAVIGVPHSSLGEAPKAFVVPQRGAEIDCDKLKEYVRGKVAPYKQLAGGISIVDSIPKNASGKILRRALRLQNQM